MVKPAIDMTRGTPPGSGTAKAPTVIEYPDGTPTVLSQGGDGTAADRETSATQTWRRQAKDLLMDFAEIPDDPVQGDGYELYRLRREGPEKVITCGMIRRARRLVGLPV